MPKTYLLLFIVQLLAHVIADFYMQSDSSCRDKAIRGFRSRFLYLHALVCGFNSWIVVVKLYLIGVLFSTQLSIESFWNFLFYSISFIPMAIVIMITHLLIDGFKSIIEKKKKRSLFFMDQIIHISVIAGVCLISIWFIPSTARILTELEFMYRWVLLLLCLLMLLKPSNIMIQKFLTDYKLEIIEPGRNLRNAGKLIGNIERVLTFVFVMLNQYGAIGFLIAAKSILRYKEADTKMAEYVLIGTLLSFGIAVLTGVMFRYI